MNQGYVLTGDLVISLGCAKEGADPQHPGRLPVSVQEHLIIFCRCCWQESGIVPDPKVRPNRKKHKSFCCKSDTAFGCAHVTGAFLDLSGFLSCGCSLKVLRPLS